MAIPARFQTWLTFRRLAAVLIVGIVGIIGSYFGLASYKAVEYTNTPGQKIGPALPADYGMPYLVVSFESQSADQLLLQGWWIERPGSERTIVLVHGRYQNRTNMLDLAVRVWERDYNVLLFDLRGHGTSPEANSTYGLQEKWDILGAVAFVEHLGLDRGAIGVLGWSLGAASALMAMDQEPGLQAVVSDSAYADGSPLLADNLLRPGLKLALRLVEGVNIDKVSPAGSVSRAKSGSVFLIHGTEDRPVPVEHLQRIQKSASDRVVGTWVVEGAGHLGAYQHDPDVYAARVDAFFKETLLAH